MTPTALPLNPFGDSDKIAAVRESVSRQIVGQPEAINALMDLLEKFDAHIQDRTRPIGSCLFLGPTGTGKTRLAEVISEELFGSPLALLKISCGEFQHSHQIAKLLGSPPGYLGHRETPALITSTRLDQWQNDKWPMSLVLFDEFDKASDALWHLMLGILDKGELTTGDNKRVDFTRSLVMFTSNTGSREMWDAMGNKLGFASASGASDKQLGTISMEAAKRKYTPEFINRLDRIVTFNTLKDADLTHIIDIELLGVQKKVVFGPLKFYIEATNRAKMQLLEDGRDPKFNGRGIRRAVERAVVIPLSRIMNQKQIGENDSVIVDYNGAYTFSKIPGVPDVPLPRNKRKTPKKSDGPLVVPFPFIPGYSDASVPPETQEVLDRRKALEGSDEPFLPKDYAC